MILSIILYTLAFIVLVLCVCIVSPLTMSADFSFMSAERFGRVKLVWIHSWIFSLWYDFVTEVSEIRILGKTIGAGKKTEKSAEPAAPDLSESLEEFAPDHTASEYVPDQTQGDDGVLRENDEIESSKSIDFPDTKKIEWSTATSPEPDLTEKFSEESTKSSDSEIKLSFFEKIKRNRYIFFLRNERWRGKIIRWVMRVFKSVFRLITFKRARLHVTAGLQDPEQTGRVYGYCVASLHALQISQRSVEITLTPVFMKDHFECSGDFSLKTSLAQMVAPALIALVSFPYLCTYIVWRRSKKLRG